MLEILKSSLIYCALEKCFTFFHNTYLNSYAAKVIYAIGVAFKDSCLGRASGRYDEREPLFIQSKTYFVIQKIMGFCKKIVDFFSYPFYKGKLSFASEAKVFNLNYEIIAFMAVLYAVFDWLFRQYVIPLASIWDELFLIVLCFVLIYKWFSKRDMEAIKVSPFDMSIVIFIGIMIVVMLISPNQEVAFEGFRAIVQSMFWFFIAFQLLKDESSVRKLSTLFVWLTGILSIHGIYQYIIGVEMPSTWISANEEGIRTRVYSIFTSPNIFGCLIVLALPMCIALLFTTKNKRKKLLFGVFAICMCASLIFTYSRGAWIGAVCAIGVYVFMKDKRLIMPVILIIILALILIPGISDRITYMLSSDYMESSMQGGRLIRWTIGMQILREHPWIGLGLGAFGGAVASNHELFTEVGGQLIDTFYMDNYYMKIIVESGLIGIIAFVFLMWQVISVSVKTVHIVENRHAKEIGIGIIAGLSGVLAHCFVENIFEVPMMGVLFWVFVAAMAQLWYCNYKKQEEEKRG